MGVDERVSQLEQALMGLTDHLHELAERCQGLADEEWRELDRQDPDHCPHGNYYGGACPGCGFGA